MTQPKTFAVPIFVPTTEDYRDTALTVPSFYAQQINIRSEI